MRNIRTAVMLALALTACATRAFGQDAPPPPPPAEPLIYPFIIRDSPPRFFTMRQVNQDYLSASRLFAGAMNAHVATPATYLIQGVAEVFLLKTMTHEEGHRAVLTSEGISSVSHPLLLTERAGYVDGVTDAALKNLRDTKFPTFIRLHTAGFESDYMMATHEETLMAFDDERYENLAIDYLARKAALLIYFTEGIFKRDSDGPEETDELQRDIVGNDLYGAIRHLYRPTMEYHRYTRFADLTDEEHAYLERIQWRTFLNLANLNLVGVRNFPITSNLRANLGLGHCMGPFGDYVDEKAWLSYGRKWDVSLYVREFENRDRWFVGAGGGITHYPLAPRLSVTATMHYWDQPEGLSFTTMQAKPGGAVDVVGSYQVVVGRYASVRAIAIDAGVIAKTAGYLPEEMSLDRHVGFRVGLSISIDPYRPAMYVRTH